MDSDDKEKTGWLLGKGQAYIIILCHALSSVYEEKPCDQKFVPSKINKGQNIPIW